MIDIKDKKDCCGCWACVQRCPKQCITMVNDDEGFLYPLVNTDLCIDCHLCEKVCPVINQGDTHLPQQCFAAVNPDQQVRRLSSSGGIFTMLAQQVIAQGGVVFGAQFNENWQVEHGYAETTEGLARFRGSKYVQSRIGDSFVKAEQFLKQGRKVLFSGTPCQVAGLRLFLRRQYDGLITVDFICHGVPSPGVWRRYLAEETARQCKHFNDARITHVTFRDKSSGWRKYSLALTFAATDPQKGETQVRYKENFKENPYLRGFLANLYSRPACHSCPAKGGKSGSDVTVADFWGVNKVFPEPDDNRGTSVVMLNTDKGCQLFQRLGIAAQECSYADIIQYNPSAVKPAKVSPRRAAFFASDSNSLIDDALKLSQPTIKQVIKTKFRRITRKFLGKTFKRKT